MRKFPKTLFVSISLEHLPISETSLKQICLDWEDVGFSFFRPAVVMEWKAEPLPLGKSKLGLNLKLTLRYWQGFMAFVLPNWYFQKEKEKLTDVLRNQIDSKNKKRKQNLLLEIWNHFWKKPISLVWLDLEFIKVRMDLNLESEEFPTALPLSYDGEKKIYLRRGYLKTIHYRWTKKEFKAPYPKFAEMYIKTRDKHNDKSLGKVYHRFLGYLLETKSDEYLLRYFGFESILTDKVRNQIPEQIWNLNSPTIKTKWIEPNLLANELEFRTVYQVSTSSQNHLK
ncbi:hypothetical protein [Leptospira perdikensis]|uniref:Uncharacterized protein n=1 Tax=Leptospira perdikensis TaxID=2484948 RepID=A0A4R9JJI5_9LEPT|nr:hypothetical protein [Leptospira perdikensis]TGL45147.1 hypothetical protein EHQ49_06745 [Leptospira perdikensis]